MHVHQHGERAVPRLLGQDGLHHDEPSIGGHGLPACREDAQGVRIVPVVQHAREQVGVGSAGHRFEEVDGKAFGTRSPTPTPSRKVRACSARPRGRPTRRPSSERPSRSWPGAPLGHHRHPSTGRTRRSRRRPRHRRLPVRPDRPCRRGTPLPAPGGGGGDRRTDHRWPARRACRPPTRSPTGWPPGRSRSHHERAPERVGRSAPNRERPTRTGRDRPAPAPPRSPAHAARG